MKELSVANVRLVIFPLVSGYSWVFLSLSQVYRVAALEASLNALLPAGYQWFSYLTSTASSVLPFFFFFPPFFSRSLISSQRQQTASAISVPHNIRRDHPPASPEQATMAEAKQPEEAVMWVVGQDEPFAHLFLLQQQQQPEETA